MNERAIFFEALDRDDPAEREAYLDQACADDPSLRKRIEVLLQSHVAAGDFMDMPAAQQLAAKAHNPGDHDQWQADETAAAQREADFPLGFLAPSQRPGSLGRLGHYEVLEVVGRGGMGVVLRVFDEKLHRVVAIKALVSELAATGSARQRFVREARAAAAVTHDNVIGIYAVEDQGPAPYLVMQFIDGPTLQEKLDRVGPLPVNEVLRVGLQIAAGLAAAHAQGLVHRDIKPANILLENGIERVKITDFGLAHAVDDASLTQSGLIAGTPAYMSPEQSKGELIDHRSDLFSLGSVLYSLCAGHSPFRGSTTIAVLKCVCGETPRPVRDINANVPEWLAAIIAKLQAKSPADRFQTAAEVADLLSWHLACLQRPDSTGHVLKAPGRKAGRNRLLRLAGPLLALVGITILGTTLVDHRDLLRWSKAIALDRAVAAQPQAPRWQPRPLSTPAELARWPSPLDPLRREAMALPEYAPPEVIAILGEAPPFRLPTRTNTHWMAQTNDGRLLAVPSGLNILLFETHAGTLYRTLRGHTNQPYRPAFSPDGKHLASGSGNFILRVWDVESGREELTLTQHRHWVWSVAYDPAGKRLVSADGGGTINVWKAQGQLLKSYRGHAKGINHLAFRPDGKRLATASLDGTCKLWDTVTWQEIRSLPSNGKTFESVAWSRDGKMLAAGDEAKVILWNAETYDVLHTLKTAGKGMLAFAPDGRTLLTAREIYTNGQPHTFTCWDVTTGAQQRTCELPTYGSRAYSLLSSDGRTVFVSLHHPADTRVGVYDAVTGQERFPHRTHDGAVHCVAVSPNGRTLASGGADQTVRLWDLTRWRPGESTPPSRILKGHTHEVWTVAFNPDGSLLASGGTDGLLLLWNTGDGRIVHDLNGHSPTKAPVTFSPDGRTVAAGSRDGAVNRWDVATGQQQELWRWHIGEVRAVAYSPDASLLASGGEDARVELLDAVTGQQRSSLRGRPPFTSLAFSPDGRTLAAACDASSTALQLWDMKTSAARDLAGHTGPILGLAFHPAGGSIATASLDGTVRLWDLRSASKAERKLDFHALGTPQCVAFSPEGRHLIVGLDNGLIAIARTSP